MKPNIIIIVGGERWAGHADIVSVRDGVATIGVREQVPIYLCVKEEEVANEKV